MELIVQGFYLQPKMANGVSGLSRSINGGWSQVVRMIGGVAAWACIDTTKRLYFANRLATLMSKEHFVEAVGFVVFWYQVPHDRGLADLCGPHRL